jgi:EmrB/QacA subfamily drug resistance transporter
MQARSRRIDYRLTFAVLLASVFAYSLMQSMVIPVLATVQQSVHTSQSTVTWLLTAFLLASAVATPIVGRLGDITGKKKMLVVTLAILAFGLLLAALASSIAVLIIARTIQGLGSAVMPLSFGIIRDEFPPPKVTSAIGVTAALLAVGGGAGIVVAGPIVDLFNYHWLFWIPLAMVVAAGVAALALIPESPQRTPGRIRWLPSLLLSGWLVALILAVSKSTTWGWTSPKTLLLIGVSLVLGFAWVLVELRSSQPLIDMRMMRVPTVWTTNLVSLLFGVAMYSVMAFVPQFVQTPTSTGYGFGATVTESGLFILPLMVTMFVTGLIAGRLAGAIGSKMVLMLGCLATVAPLAMYAFAHSQPWEISLASGLLGVGTGLAFAAMPSLIVEAVPAHQVGVASGMNVNIRLIGGSFGAAIMSSLVTATIMADGYPAESGYTRGFLFITVAAVGATLACLAIPGTRRVPTENTTPTPLGVRSATTSGAGATLAGAD